MFKIFFNKDTNKNTDKKFNIDDYDNEINKFLTSNDPANINIHLILDFLLDKTNNLNKKFIDFCNKQLCLENVKFIYEYHEVKLLKKYKDILDKSIEIYYNYIDDKAKMQLNLDSSIVQNIKTILKIDGNKGVLSNYTNRLYTRSMKERLQNVYNDTYNHIHIILANNTIINFIKEYHLFILGDALSDAHSLRSSNPSTKSTIDNNSSRSSFKNDSDRSGNDSSKSNKSPSLKIQTKMIESITRKLSKTDLDIDIDLPDSLDTYSRKSSNSSPNIKVEHKKINSNESSPTIKVERKVGIRRNSIINYDNISNNELDIIKEIKE